MSTQSHNLFTKYHQNISNVRDYHQSNYREVELNRVQTKLHERLVARGFLLAKIIPTM